MSKKKEAYKYGEKTNVNRYEESALDFQNVSKINSRRQK